MEEDLEGPRHKHLIGRLVLFCSCIICAVGGFWIGRFTAPEKIVVQNTSPAPIPTVPPADTTYQDEVIPTVVEMFKYSPLLGGKTYTDTIAKFSFQYSTAKNATGARMELGTYEYGKKVTMKNCFVPAQQSKEICQNLYSISVFNNYDGGSRRVWLSENAVAYAGCGRYYKDITVSGKNALISTGPCGSWGETFVVIPNGKQMIMYSADHNARDEKSGEIKLPEWLNSSLKTFRFI